MLSQRLANIRRALLQAQADGRDMGSCELGILADQIEGCAHEAHELERHTVPNTARPEIEGEENVVDLTQRRRPAPRLAPGPTGGGAA